MHETLESLTNVFGAKEIPLKWMRLSFDIFHVFINNAINTENETFK